MTAWFVANVLTVLLYCGNPPLAFHAKDGVLYMRIPRTMHIVETKARCRGDT